MIASEEGTADALTFDRSGRYSQKGRVPLFYSKELELPPEEGSTMEKRLPAYFNKKDLISDWGKQFPDKSPPQIEVMDLLETFQAMVIPGGRNEILKNLVFIPTQTAVAEAAEVKSRQGSATYQMSDMIMVGGK